MGQGQFSAPQSGGCLRDRNLPTALPMPRTANGLTLAVEVAWRINCRPPRPCFVESVPASFFSRSCPIPCNESESHFLNWKCYPRSPAHSFLAAAAAKVNAWFLRKGQKCLFRKQSCVICHWAIQLSGWWKVSDQGSAVRQCVIRVMVVFLI